jgi:enediyne biosynthesis protein E3
VFSVSHKNPVSLANPVPSGLQPNWLKHTAQIFQRGFVSALKERSITLETARAAVSDNRQIGVFIEGAAMASYLMDIVTPWKKNRWQRLLTAVGDLYPIQLYLGMGMAISQANQPLKRHLEHLDPLLRPFVVDGFGFHTAYFRGGDVSSDALSDCKGHLRRVLDQGMGRSIWFASAGNAETIATKLASLPKRRHRDLWIGLGVAAAYAGGTDHIELTKLASQAGRHRRSLAQGAAFAAYVRNLSGHPAEHTNAACKIFCSLESIEAAKIVQGAFRRIRISKSNRAHDQWQTKVRDTLVASVSRNATVGA